MSDVHVLISPDAGRGRTAGTATDVLDRLRLHGAHVIDITAATAERSLAAAHDAVAAGAERLVVLGGDGIVHLGAQAVAGTDTVLGVVPIGTGNDFARGIDWIPDDSLEAAAIALADPSPIDAIRCGDQWTVSVATGGFSGDVNGRANHLTRPKGPSRYTIATLLELPRLRPRSVELVVDGEHHTVDTVMVAVANTAWFGGGMQICPDAAPTDGLLDVTVVGPIGRVELLRFFNRVFKGTHLSHPKVHTHRGTTIELRATDLDLWGDGEPLGSAPMVFEAVPGALWLAGG